jgi:hypothetical protein
MQPVSGCVFRTQQPEHGSLQFFEDKLLGLEIAITFLAPALVRHYQVVKVGPLGAQATGSPISSAHPNMEAGPFRVNAPIGNQLATG